jgi:cell wall-associated NlpC family hydrolase
MIDYCKQLLTTSKFPLIFSSILLTAILLNSCGALAPQFYYSYDQDSKPLNAEQVEKLKVEIRKYYKAPYQWGGNSTYGTDCSGFISAVYYNALGVVIPHNAAELYANCIPIRSNQLQFGDLIFFGKNDSKPTHVGLYIDKRYFMDATKEKGVALHHLDSIYYRRQFVGAGRIKIN